MGNIELFCLAAELNSFTAAAVAARVTPAAVSRAISRLENRLNIQLFIRNTRQIRLTPAGTLYFERCQHALSVISDAERIASEEQMEPSGIIRISMPTTYAHYRIFPLLSRFRERYPKVDFHMHISNRNVSFLDEGFDLSIRARNNGDSNLIARKIEDAELVIVASPSYLAARGEPRTINDLLNHECIQFELPSSGRQVPWLFSDANEDIEVHTKGGIRCTEEVLGGVTLAKSGAGLYQIYRFVVEQELLSGQLIEVLKPYGGRSRPFSVLYPYSRFIASRVRVFMDFLLASVEHLEGSRARRPQRIVGAF